MSDIPNVVQIERLASLADKYGFATIVAFVLLLALLTLVWRLVTKLGTAMSELQGSVNSAVSELKI